MTRRLAATVVAGLVLVGVATSPRTGTQAADHLEVGSRQFLVDGPGEIEVGVSGDGQQVIAAVNGIGGNPLDVPLSRDRIFYSLDGGVSFHASTIAGTHMGTSRDPTVAWTGAKTVDALGKIHYGKFYFATMGSEKQVRVATSIDGAVFAAAGSMFCRGSSCEGDQPHMAGDRRPGQDQVYIVWRNRRGWLNIPPDNFFSVIACSTDGGVTWGRRIVEFDKGIPDRHGDYPRLAVGPDGYVYVIMATSRTDGDLLLQRFSPCSDGMQPFWTDSSGHSAPSWIGHFKGVYCIEDLWHSTIAGLDRCNRGNILASPTIAVDDTNPRRVFVSYADETSKGNHDVVLIWTDDVTRLARNEAFSGSKVINSESRGERYFPWACATQGKVYVGWYDRRSRTARRNDKTEYVVGDNDAHEADVSDAIDRQCGSGWATGGGRVEAEACSRQPQLAGFCLACPGGSHVGDGNCQHQPTTATTRCDYDETDCGQHMSCVAPKRDMGRGKYGDYNGMACAQGKVYAAWASAAAPSELPAVSGLSVFFARVDRVSVSTPPESVACGICRDDRNDCMDDADSHGEIQVCVGEYRHCRQANSCQ